MTDVVVVQTGVANTASVLAGLRRVGVNPQLTENPDQVRTASRVVLPGVGSFGAAMERLRALHLDEALCERICAGHPTLAVCLGLQVLCSESEESPGVPGLGLLPLHVGRFPQSVRVPQLGWNRIEPDPSCTILEAGHMYFANSYCLSKAPDGWSAAWADHGGRFVAALERGPLLACQFHPELSGALGRDLLARWLHAAQKGGC